MLIHPPREEHNPSGAVLMSLTISAQTKMKLRPIFTILAATTALCPTLLQAAPFQMWRHHQATGKVRPAPQRNQTLAQQRNLTLAHMNLTPPTVLARPYGEAGWSPGAEVPFRAFSRQVAPDGPVGSVGLVNFTGRGPLDADALGNAVASQNLTQGPGRRLGVNLTYAFR